MSKWNKGLMATMEEFDEVEQTVLTGMHARDEEGLQLSIVHREMDTLNGSITDAFQGAQQLHELSEAIVDVDTPIASAIAQISVESVYKRLGISNRMLPSLEDYKHKVALEFIGKAVSAVWDAIKKAISKLIELIGNFFNWLFGKNTKKEQQLKQLQSDLAAATKNKPTIVITPNPNGEINRNLNHLKEETDELRQRLEKHKVDTDKIIKDAEAAYEKANKTGQPQEVPVSYIKFQDYMFHLVYTDSYHIRDIARGIKECGLNLNSIKEYVEYNLKDTVDAFSEILDGNKDIDPKQINSIMYSSVFNMLSEAVNVGNLPGNHYFGLEKRHMGENGYIPFVQHKYYNNDNTHEYKKKAPKEIEVVARYEAAALLVEVSNVRKIIEAFKPTSEKLKAALVRFREIFSQSHTYQNYSVLSPYINAYTDELQLLATFILHIVESAVDAAEKYVRDIFAFYK